MPKSVDGGEFFEDFVGRFPSLINHQFHFVNVILINAVRRIYSAGNLIEIVACTAKQGNQITEFGQLQLDYISVDSHFAKICRHIDSACLCHTLINQDSFLRCHTELYLSLIHI